MNSSMKYSSVRKQKTQHQIAREYWHWLQDRTSWWSHGMKKGSQHFYTNTEKRVRLFYDWLNSPRNVEDRVWLRKISLANIKSHLKDVDKYYFTGTDERSKPTTLVMIDIDAGGKRIGSAEGALAAANYIKSFFPAGLHCEISTNGTGQHPYFVLRKRKDAEFLNKKLKELERVMKEKLVPYFDVKDIEIKGSISTIVDNVPHYGSMAFIPRDTNVMNTCEIDIDDLDRIIAKIGLADLTNKLEAKSGEVILRPDAKPGSESIKTAKSSYSGSYMAVTDEQLEDLDLCRSACNDKSIDGVVSEDLAIACWLTRLFTMQPNEDGTMPTKRFESLWTALYQDGVLTRSFDKKRFARLRKALEQLGWIDIVDPTYYAGRQEGKFFVKGRAAKWHTSQDFMTLFISMKELRDSQDNKDRTSLEEAVKKMIEQIEIKPLSETTRLIQVIVLPRFDEWNDPGRITEHLLAA